MIPRTSGSDHVPVGFIEDRIMMLKFSPKNPSAHLIHGGRQDASEDTTAEANYYAHQDPQPSIASVRVWR